MITIPWYGFFGLMFVIAMFALFIGALFCRRELDKELLAERDISMLYKSRWENSDQSKKEFEKLLDAEFEEASIRIRKEAQEDKDTNFYSGYLWGLLFAKQRVRPDVHYKVKL